MPRNDRIAGRNRFFTEFFLSFGAGHHYFQTLTSAKAWNLIAWLMVAAGTIAWIAFLTWQPV